MAKKKISKKAAKRKPRGLSTRGKGAAKKTAKKKAKISRKVSKKAQATKSGGAKKRTALPAGPPAGPAERAELLVALGERAFPDLTDTERDVLRAAAYGHVCDVAQEGDETFPDAEWGCWESWPDRRKVRGTVIRWICTEPSALQLVDQHGVRVRNALIVGSANADRHQLTVDLANVSIPFSLAFQACALPHMLVLNQARLRDLDIQYARCAGLRAVGLTTTSDIRAEWVCCRGTVDLVDADIGGSLMCSGGSFACAKDKDGNPVGEQPALRADRLRVAVSAWLDNGFKADGEVRLLGADIGANLTCTGGSFACAKDTDGNPLSEPDALSADGLKVGANAWLNGGFEADGEVRLPGADIGGNLICTGGSFACAKDKDGNPVEKPHALSADGLKVGADARLDHGFKADGMVRLLGGDIGGSLACTGGLFACARDKGGNPVGELHALSADGLRVGADARLDSGFKADGMVRLLGADIGGDLSCIGGSYACAKNKDGNPVGTPYSLNAESMVVHKATFLRDAHFAASDTVNLTAANLGYLIDDEAGWPNAVMLTATTYRAVHPQGRLDAKWRLEWLARHDKTVREQFGQAGFDSQPYHQIASVLRKQGHEKWADQIMVSAGWKRIKPAFRDLWNGSEVEWMQRAWTRMSWLNGVWIRMPYSPPMLLESLIPVAMWPRRIQAVVTLVGRTILGAVVGHGYARARPLAWLVAFVLLGWIAFSVNVQDLPLERRMQPTQSLALKDWRDRGYTNVWVNKYPDYSPLGYSLDTFLPLVNLHQDQYWTPRTWWVKRLYLPFHVMSGWVVTTLFVVGFTGLVRQEKR